MLFPGTPILTSWLGWNYGSGRDTRFIITFIHHPLSSLWLYEKQATCHHEYRAQYHGPSRLCLLNPAPRVSAWVAQLQYGSWRECPAKKSEHCLRCSESEVFIPEGNLVPRPMAPAQEHCCPTSLPFQTKQWAQLCPFKGIAGNYPWRPSHFNGTQGGTCSRLCLGLGYAAGVQKHSCGEKNPKW